MTDYQDTQYPELDYDEVYTHITEEQFAVALEADILLQLSEDTYLVRDEDVFFELTGLMPPSQILHLHGDELYFIAEEY